MDGNGHISTIPPAPRPVRTTIAYGLMIAATVAIFYLIRDYGEGLSAPPPAEGSKAPGAVGHGEDVVFHVLLALAAVVGLGVLLGRLFTYLGQPPVIGELVAGIVLGPSLLGMIAPGAYEFLLPKTVEFESALKIIAQIGVILYMFLIGLELNGATLRGAPRCSGNLACRNHRPVYAWHSAVVGAVHATVG